MKKTSVPRYFTLEDIKSHIGLSVEVTNRFEAVLTKKDFLEKFNKELDKIDL